MLARREERTASVLRLETVEGLLSVTGQSRSYRHGSRCAIHSSANVGSGRRAWSRSGQRDKAGDVILGLQGDDIDVELCGELHGEAPSARALRSDTSFIPGRRLTARGCQASSMRLPAYSTSTWRVPPRASTYRRRVSI